MAQAKRHFAQHFQILADGHEVAIAPVHFPTEDDVLEWKAAGHVPRLPVLLTVDETGQLPGDARNVAFVFPEIVGPIVLTVERPEVEAYTEPVEAGVPSSAIAVAVSTIAETGSKSAAAPARRASPPERTGVLALVGRFVVLGFEHILPRGLDHVLFVLGLFLLGGRISALLWQVTAFTLAHSVTLGLSLYGVVRPPAVLVEPLIAISIVLVAIDNLRGAELRWWRVLIVFAFGLVHGLGFAGVLRGLGLPSSEFPPILIGFNLGVELGQLAVIASAFLAVGWFRHRSFYRRRIVIPASVCIGAIATVWTVQRLAGIGIR